jgi:hypothetical protein
MYIENKLLMFLKTIKDFFRIDWYKPFNDVMKKKVRI